jgi:hypothetical protein
VFKLSAYDNKSDPREHDEVALEWVTVMAVPLINILLKYIIMLSTAHIYILFDIYHVYVTRTLRIAHLSGQKVATKKTLQSEASLPPEMVK